jgi:DNA-binding beta-propeller fold protein YncE
LWHVQWTDAARHDATGWHVAVDATSHRIFFSGQQHTRAYLVAVSPQGAVVWNDEDASAQRVTPVGLAVDPSAGRVYVTGTMAIPPTTDHIVTWADTTAGQRVWHAERGTTGRTRAAAIRADPDRGQVYVVGTAPKGGSTGSLTIAYTA